MFHFCKCFQLEGIKALARLPEDCRSFADSGDKHGASTDPPEVLLPKAMPCLGLLRQCLLTIAYFGVPQKHSFLLVTEAKRWDCYGGAVTFGTLNQQTTTTGFVAYGSPSILGDVFLHSEGQAMCGSYQKVPRPESPQTNRPNEAGADSTPEHCCPLAEASPQPQATPPSSTPSLLAVLAAHSLPWKGQSPRTFPVPVTARDRRDKPSAASRKAA